MQATKAAERKVKKDCDERWEDNREVRVSSWKDFQARPGPRNDEQAFISQHRYPLCPSFTSKLLLFHICFFFTSTNNFPISHLGLHTAYNCWNHTESFRVIVYYTSLLQY